MERNFNQTQYTVTNLFAAQYMLRERSYSCPDRPRSALLLPLCGGMVYEFEDRCLEVGVGDMLYLPKTSSYTYHVSCKKTELMQVELELKIIDGAGALDRDICAVPSKLSVNPTEARSLFFSIIQGYDSRLPERSMQALSALYRLLGWVLTVRDEKRTNRLDRAIAYMESHKLESVSVGHLASMCRLSETQFRRLFRERIGMAPLKYKNSMILQMARELLRDETLSVTEIAELLNFEDVYAFSKFFKRETGHAPTLYRKGYDSP